jgi:topoisomerase-4 subunit A
MILSYFEVSRYSKPIMMFKLKDKDEVVSISRCDGDNTVVITSDNFALRYNTSEIPVVGLRASGVKSVKLNANAEVITSFVASEFKEYVTLFTNRNTAKRFKVTDIPLLARAKRGSQVIKSPKSKQYSTIKAFNTSSKNIFGIMNGEVGYLKSSDISIMDLASTGSGYTKKEPEEIFVVTRFTDITVQEKETNEEVEEEPKKQEIIKEEKVEVETQPKEEQLTMSDFFEEFKI